MKKSFSHADTAAEQLFTIATPKKEQETAPIHPDTSTKTKTETAPAQSSNDVIFVSWRARPDVNGEKRSHRMQIVLKPSVANMIRTIASDRRLSINHLIETLIIQAWQEHTATDDK